MAYSPIFLRIASSCCSKLQWRHNGLDGVSNHQPHHCLLSRLFGRRSKKTSKLRVTGLCAGNSPGKMFPFGDVIMNVAYSPIFLRISSSCCSQWLPQQSHGCPQGAVSLYKHHLSRYNHSHYKDKTVVRPSNLYDEHPNADKILIRPSAFFRIHMCW